MWSYDSYMSSITAAQTIHISSSLQLWIPYVQEVCWNHTLTSDNNHLTLSLLSESVFVHPTLRRNCLQSKAYVLFAEWPSEVALMKKCKGEREPSFQPVLTDHPGLLQILHQGSAHCCFARTSEEQDGLFTLIFHTNGVTSLDFNQAL